MARYLLCNRVIYPGSGVELKAGKEVDDQQYDVGMLRSSGAVLLALPNPVVEARAEFVRREMARGRRGAELDLLTAAFAEFANAAVSSSVVVDGVCGPGDVVGALVRASGPAVGGAMQVAPVDPTDAAKMPCVGRIFSKSSPTTCLVTLFGLVTVGGLTPGMRYYAGVGGVLAVAPFPGAPRPLIVQYLGSAIDENRLFFHPSHTLTRLT